MKHILKRVLILLFALTSLTQCQDPIEGINISVNFDSFFPTYVLINVNDADGVSGPPEEISLELLGGREGAFIEISGREDFELVKGQVNLAVKPDSTFSLDAPLKVTVVARAEGYLEAIGDLVISKSGAYYLDLQMIRLDNPPEGVAAKAVTTQTDASGALLSDFVEVLDAANGMETPMRITIPAGTILLDESDNPVTGDISGAIVGFDADNASFFDTYPGKIIGGDMTGENGAQVTPVPMSMIKVLLTGSNGTSVISFVDGLMTVEIAMKNGIINPETGSEYQEGESVGTESMATQKSKWKSEKGGTVRKSQQGSESDLTTEFETGHLSYFLTHRAVVEDCPGPRTVTINLTNSRSALQDIHTLDLGYKLEIEYNSASVSETHLLNRGYVRVAWNLETKVFDPVSISFDSYPNFANAPASLAGQLILTIYHNENEVERYILNGGCMEEETLNFTMDETYFSSLDVITMDVQGICPDNDRTIIRPTLTMMYRTPSAPTYQYLGALVQGRASVTALKLGETYEISAVIRDKSRSEVITFDKSEIIYQISDMDDLKDICE